MNALIEQLFYQRQVPEPQHGDPAILDKLIQEWADKPISHEPVVDETKIEFTLAKHRDGSYSAKIVHVPAEDKEVDDYGKWLAGSFVRSLAALESIVQVDDPENIAATKFPFNG